VQATLRYAVVFGCSLSLLAACAPMTPAAEETTEQSVSSLQTLVETVRQDPTARPQLARALMDRKVLIVPDPHAKTVVPLKIDQNERSFIPVFSDAATFAQEAYGTGFENKAVVVDACYFASVLNGDETVILNPGHRPAIEFRASELKALVDPRRAGCRAGDIAKQAS